MREGDISYFITGPRARPAAGKTLPLVVREREDVIRERKRQGNIGASKFSRGQSMEML